MKITTKFLFVLLLAAPCLTAFAGAGTTLAERLYPKRDFGYSNGLTKVFAPPGGGGDLAFDEQKIVITAGYGFGNLASALFISLNY